MQFQFSGTPQTRRFDCACVLCLPRPEQFRQPEAWAPSPQVQRTFSLCGKWLGQPEAWAPSPRVWRAFSLRGSGSQRLGHTLPGYGVPFPSVARAARGLSALSRVWCTFSLHGPSVRRLWGLRKSLDRNRGPICSVGGVASLGLSLPLSPSPCLLPPAGMGGLFSGVSQSLCFANRHQCVRAG